jgi:flagellar hook-basal body complex protein FliE
MDLSAMAQWLGGIMTGAQNPSKQADAAGNAAAGLGPVDGAAGAGSAGSTGSAGDAFGSLLKRATESVVTPQAQSAAVVENFARGTEGEVHQSMMQMEKGDISFKFFMTAKNKCIEAYKEILRMG